MPLPVVFDIDSCHINFVPLQYQITKNLILDENQVLCFFQFFQLTIVIMLQIINAEHNAIQAAFPFKKIGK